MFEATQFIHSFLLIVPRSKNTLQTCQPFLGWSSGLHFHTLASELSPKVSDCADLKAVMDTLKCLTPVVTCVKGQVRLQAAQWWW